MEKCKNCEKHKSLFAQIKSIETQVVKLTEWVENQQLIENRNRIERKKSDEFMKVLCGVAGAILVEKVESPLVKDGDSERVTLSL